MKDHYPTAMDRKEKALESKATVIFRECRAVKGEVSVLQLPIVNPFSFFPFAPGIHMNTTAHNLQCLAIFPACPSPSTPTACPFRPVTISVL